MQSMNNLICHSRNFLIYVFVCLRVAQKRFETMRRRHMFWRWFDVEKYPLFLHAWHHRSSSEEKRHCFSGKSSFTFFTLQRLHSLGLCTNCRHAVIMSHGVAYFYYSTGFNECHSAWFIVCSVIWWGLCTNCRHAVIMSHGVAHFSHSDWH